MQACSARLPEEPSCNFVRNSQAQRVSWSSNEPMLLYIDQSVPQSYVFAIESAADKWNISANRTLIKVLNSDRGEAYPSKDGISKIYFMDTWDANRPTEQARTTVHWRGSVLQEADIRINLKNFDYFLDISAYNSNAVHFESLVLHEIGHALGLAHNESDKSVMQTSLGQGSIRDTVGAEDLSSITCEYGS